MTELLTDPLTWTAIVISIIVAAVVGRLRREPWLATAMTVIGFNAFLLGIRWAGGMAIWGGAVRIGSRKPALAES